MKKSLAVGVLSASILTLSVGAIAASQGVLSGNAGSMTEIIDMSTDALTTENEDIAAIDQAVLNGVSQIEDAAADAVSQVQAAATTTTTKEVTTMAETATTTTTIATDPTGVVSYDLNNGPKNAYGIITFYKVIVDYDAKTFDLYYKQQQPEGIELKFTVKSIFYGNTPVDNITWIDAQSTVNPDNITNGIAKFSFTGKPDFSLYLMAFNMGNNDTPAIIPIPIPIA